LRATTYLSQGRHAQALSDFSTLLTLKPDFYTAHLQRSRILSKEGQFSQALEALGKWLQSPKGKADGESKELELEIKQAARAEKEASIAEGQGEWDLCIEKSSEALRTGPNSLSLRELRLRAYSHLGDSEGYIGDLNRLSILQPGSPTRLVQLSHLALLLENNPQRALGYLKQALHYDPESPKLTKLHKTFRRLDKDLTRAKNFFEGNNWKETVKVLSGEKGEKGLIRVLEELIAQTDQIPDSFIALETSKTLLDVWKKQCTSHLNLNAANKQELSVACEKVLKMKGGEEDIDALTGRGEVLMKKEDWEGAVRAFNEAFEKGGRSSRDVS
jgi:DnaJ family protein C protein 3